MLKKILIGLAVVVAFALAFVATRPAAFHVERSVSVAAPPDIVFAQVNDLHTWVQWSPWEKKDPTMKKAYDGATAGPGSIYSWSGNDDVGNGKMTIVSAKPAEQIDIKLEFFKPFAATNQTRFTFKPSGNATMVTWAMEGQNNFMLKAMSVFMNMDKMVGPDFEAGLASLKSLAEAEVIKRGDSMKAAAAEPQPHDH